MNIAIVASEFHKDIVQKMVDAAHAQAKNDNHKIVSVTWVPGALEIPFALKKILAKKKVDTAACLGAVIQGKTEHDRLVAFTSAKAILDLSLLFDKPVSICIAGPRISRALAAKRATDYGTRSIETLTNLQKNLKTL